MTGTGVAERVPELSVWRDRGTPVTITVASWSGAPSGAGSRAPERESDLIERIYEAARQLHDYREIIARLVSVLPPEKLREESLRELVAKVRQLHVDLEAGARGASADRPAAGAPAAGPWLRAELDRLQKCGTEPEWDALPRLVEERLAAIAPDDVDYLIARIRGPLRCYREGEAITRALGILGEARDEDRARLVNALRQQLESPFAQVRIAATESLWQVGGPLVREHLRRAQEDSDDWVRRTATTALRALGG